MGKATLNDYNLIKYPVITEKGSSEGGAATLVVLRVPQQATRQDVKGAVERVFNVQVEGVRTLNVLGKRKRTAKGYAKRENFKKAYVTLAKGQSINMIEGL